MLTFLSGIISAFIYSCLKERVKNASLYSKEELVQQSYKNFAELKAVLQNAVAAGVEGGVQSYAGDTEEYYCLIKPVPPVVNKKLC